MIAAVLEGVQRRLEREHNDRAWLAWHTAALPRTRRFPALRSMLIQPRSRKTQTWQEQLTVCRMIAAAYGGTA